VRIAEQSEEEDSEEEEKHPRNIEIVKE